MRLMPAQRLAVQADQRPIIIVAAEYGISRRQVARIREATGNGFKTPLETRAKVSAGLTRYWSGPAGKRKLPPMTNAQRYLYRLIREQAGREVALRHVFPRSAKSPLPVVTAAIPRQSSGASGFPQAGRATLSAARVP